MIAVNHIINAVMTTLARPVLKASRENKVKIVRADNNKRKTIPANHDTLVLPGDVIEVPERFF